MTGHPEKYRTWLSWNLNLYLLGLSPIPEQSYLLMHKYFKAHQINRSLRLPVSLMGTQDVGITTSLQNLYKGLDKFNENAR